MLAWSEDSHANQAILPAAASVEYQANDQMGSLAFARHVESRNSPSLETSLEWLEPTIIAPQVFIVAAGLDWSDAVCIGGLQLAERCQCLHVAGVRAAGQGGVMSRCLKHTPARLRCGCVTQHDLKSGCSPCSTYQLSFPDLQQRSFCVMACGARQQSENSRDATQQLTDKGVSAALTLLRPSSCPAMTSNMRSRGPSGKLLQRAL